VQLGTIEIGVGHDLLEREGQLVHLLVADELLTTLALAHRRSFDGVIEVREHIDLVARRVRERTHDDPRRSPVFRYIEIPIEMVG